MTGYRGRHRDRRLRGVLAAILGVVSVLVSLAGVGAYGGYVARVANTNDSAATNSYFTCLNAAVGESGTRALFAYPFGDPAGATTVSDVSGNANQAGSYSAGIGLGTAGNGVCPRDNRTVVDLNGTTNYILGPTAAVAAPNTFTEEIWFNTRFAQGKLIGFGNNRGAQASGTYDRHLYIATSGRLVFGVGGQNTISSAASVTDGAWHHAVATLSSAGMALYLDGTQVAINMGVTSGQLYLFGGWWRIGYDALLAWPGAGSGYFRGSLAYAAVYGYAMTQAQVTAHYVAGR